MCHSHLSIARSFPKDIHSIYQKWSYFAAFPWPRRHTDKSQVSAVTHHCTCNIGPRWLVACNTNTRICKCIEVRTTKSQVAEKRYRWRSLCLMLVVHELRPSKLVKLRPPPPLHTPGHTRGWDKRSAPCNSNPRQHTPALKPCMILQSGKLQGTEKRDEIPAPQPPTITSTATHAHAITRQSGERRAAMGAAKVCQHSSPFPYEETGILPCRGGARRPAERAQRCRSPCRPTWPESWRRA